MSGFKSLLTLSAVALGLYAIARNARQGSPDAEPQPAPGPAGPPPGQAAPAAIPQQPDVD